MKSTTLRTVDRTLGSQNTERPRLQSLPKKLMYRYGSLAVGCLVLVTSREKTFSGLSNTTALPRRSNVMSNTVMEIYLNDSTTRNMISFSC